MKSIAKNSVFIACSLDGYIADKNHGIEWLLSLPNPTQDDMGYNDFIKDIDALVMGRNTFEIVHSFEGEWPYPKPVFVISNSMKEIPVELREKVFLVQGEIKEILKTLHSQGYHRLFIDGGKTIQSFLKEDLIDDMIITTIPYLLGGGIPLFGELDQQLNFQCVKTKLEINSVAQCRYIRAR